MDATKTPGSARLLESLKQADATMREHSKCLRCGKPTSGLALYGIHYVGVQRPSRERIGLCICGNVWCSWPKAPGHRIAGSEDQGGRTHGICDQHLREFWNEHDWGNPNA